MPTTNPTAPRERLVSYRLSLLLVTSLLVAGSGALIIANTYVGMRETVTALTRRIFSEATRKALVNSRNRVRMAIPAIETLANHLEGSPAVASDRDAIASGLLDVLRANPTFVRVSWSDVQGSFTSALRTASGQILLNENTMHDGRSELNEYSVDAQRQRTLARHVDDTHYDPRTRPYFRLATERHARAWTDPRILAENDAPGITCARPIYAREGGALVGVFTVDFDLSELSAFLARRHFAPHGRLFVFAADGAMIAAARVGVVRRGPNDVPEIATTRTIDDPLIRTYHVEALRHRMHLVRSGGDENEQFEFSFGGERWFAAYDPFDVDDGTQWVVAAAAPESDFMGDVERRNRVSLAISAVALAVSLILAALFATQMSRRLSALAIEMERVGQFRLDSVRGGRRSVMREFAMMNRALDAMKQGLRSFASFVPADLVRAVLESGQEARLGGRLRPMTAFFSDIAGFTSVAEEMTPEALVAMLGDYLEGMTRVIATEKGTVDKFIGDGIMAFWGAPKELEDHAARACEAAVRCQRKLEEMQRTGSPEMKRLTTRIGVATGDVLVGNIGTPERMNYTVMGDVVNLASRLEGLNKQYGTRVMASEATVAAAGGRVVARPIDVVAVKGKARGVKVYELMALTADHDERAEKIAALSEEALTAYLARDFSKAAEGWERVLEIAPGDSAATLMRDRARGLATAPPPAEWDGVNVSHEK